MSQKFHDNGETIPVTLVKAEPNEITRVINLDKDKYHSIQIGLGLKKKGKEKTKARNKFRYLREFKVEDFKDLREGGKIDVSVFKKGDKVKVIGVSKGKGFQGVVKRHGFSGGPASHGHKDQARMPGSIGSAFPQRVLKGKKMGGRMGGKKATVRNLEIFDIDKDKNLIFIKGALPGPKKGLLLINTL